MGLSTDGLLSISSLVLLSIELFKPAKGLKSISVLLESDFSFFITILKSPLHTGFLVMDTVTPTIEVINVRVNINFFSLKNMIKYAEIEKSNGERYSNILRHLIGMFRGFYGAKRLRSMLVNEIDNNNKDYNALEKVAKEYLKLKRGIK